MKIILNSDVLYSTKPGYKGLPQHIEEFFSRLNGLGATVVLPRPAFLELERHDQTSELKSATELERAIRMLAEHGVSIEQVDTASLTRSPGIAALIRATGVPLLLVDPEMEDYRDAERRACLRLPPHPPEIKSDEMRDLVIWSVALRLAKQDGRAILLSRDEVHSHERGGEESSGHGLMRAKDFQEALTLLGEESPTVKKARDALALVWPALRSRTIPLPEHPSHELIRGASFVVGQMGETASKIALVTPDGLFSADVIIEQLAPGKVRARLSNVVNKSDPAATSEVEVIVDGSLDADVSFSMSLQELKRLIEGQS